MVFGGSVKPTGLPVDLADWTQGCSLGEMLGSAPPVGSLNYPLPVPVQCNSGTRAVMADMPPTPTFIAHRWATFMLLVGLGLWLILWGCRF